MSTLRNIRIGDTIGSPPNYLSVTAVYPFPFLVLRGNTGAHQLAGNTFGTETGLPRVLLLWLHWLHLPERRESAQAAFSLLSVIEQHLNFCNSCIQMLILGS